MSQPRDDLGAQSDLATLRTNEQRRGVGRQQFLRRDGFGRAARVVAVIAQAVVDEVFGLAPRSENQPELGTRQTRALGPAVGCDRALDADVEMVVANPRDAAQP